MAPARDASTCNPALACWHNLQRAAHFENRHFPIQVRNALLEGAGYRFAEDKGSEPTTDALNARVREDLVDFRRYSVEFTVSV